jgi:thiosulfate/3-mercaptopyruvate sulfurtransferase
MSHTTLISPTELAARIPDPAWVVVDCRHDLADDPRPLAPRAGAGAWRRVRRSGHLRRRARGLNGRHPLPRITDVVATFSRAGIDSSKQVVAYDQNNGMWASRLWWILQWLGHPAAAVLDGGLDRWLAEGQLLTAEEPRVQPAKFRPA